MRSMKDFLHRCFVLAPKFYYLVIHLKKKKSSFLLALKSTWRLRTVDEDKKSSAEIPPHKYFLTG